MNRTIPLGDGGCLDITQDSAGAWTLHYTAPGREDIVVVLSDEANARQAITWLLAGAMQPEITLDPADLQRSSSPQG
ncbi:hypothetical protein EIL87_11735 [Saccharopolyspora rhizosphaerae]|uniref:Uncharacterized protein n=1 Tax=Saccharopolyspora rhizosphaerae TaxID=2492662 RepID=A0A3R8VGD0_9PSEU|nr:hypothetical protein [Saccharopolyspora rhizosphaerae]RRO16947.1 hypothetical protein EIL87_11735 [Saccharopolyspora rhizosphaerae]